MVLRCHAITNARMVYVIEIQSFLQWKFTKTCTLYVVHFFSNRPSLLMKTKHILWLKCLKKRFFIELCPEIHSKFMCSNMRFLISQFIILILIKYKEILINFLMNFMVIDKKLDKKWDYIELDSDYYFK